MYGDCLIYCASCVGNCTKATNQISACRLEKPVTNFAVAVGKSDLTVMLVKVCTGHLCMPASKVKFQSFFFFFRRSCLSPPLRLWN